MRKIKALGEDRCIAGVKRNARGRLAAHCVSKNITIDVYFWYLCGSGPARGIEAIAQARAVRAYNQDPRWARVSPDTQWEVRTSAGTADIVHLPGAGYHAEVIEVKGEWGNAAGAAQQARDYADAFGADSANSIDDVSAAPKDFAADPYSDEFKVLRRNDGQGRLKADNRCAAEDAVLETYTARGLAEAELKGVIWVELKDFECVDDDDAAERREEQLERVAADVPASDDRRTNRDNTRRVGPHGFTGTMNQLYRDIANQLDGELGQRLLSHVIADVGLATVVYLTRGQFELMARNMESYLRLLSRKVAQVGSQQFDQLVRQRLVRIDLITRAAQTRASAQALNGGNIAVLDELKFTAAERQGIREALDSTSRRAVNRATIEALDGYVERVLGRALLTRGATRLFLGVGGRALLAGIPYIGWAALTAWMVYDAFMLAKSFLDIVSWGDPHLITLDRRTYDLQTVGEFTLANAPSKDFTLQGRYVPWNANTSITEAIAIELGETRIQIETGDRIKIDGETVEFEDGHAEYLDDGSVMYRMGTEYLITNADDSIQVMYDRGQVSLHDPERAVRSGLLGSHDGNPNNDLVTADGEPLPKNVAPQVLHGRYADSWRVTDETTLFTYADGKSTADHTDRSFPQNILTIADFPASDIEAAAGTCRAHQVMDGPVFDDCVYDLLLTGDATYAASAAAVTGEVSDPLAKGFGADGVLDEDFTTPVAQNFAHPRYLNDPATSRAAGPLFDTSGYSFYAVDVPRHEATEVSMDLIAYGPIDTDQLTLNRPGMSGDSSRWESWSHVREQINEVPRRAA